MLWEQNNILRKQDNILWEKKVCCGNKISFLWEQNNELWEQDIILREYNF